MEKKRNGVFTGIKQDWESLLKGFLITLSILSVVTALSFLLRRIDGNDEYVPMLFVTAIFLISRYTNGYIFGIISSVIGVFLVNYIFTYPYFQFNFTISGYPITFISMLGTSIITSAMTTRIKQQERIRLEAERESIRGNLLRAVSHDLRTPLTSIIGTISALLDNEGKLSKEQEQELLRESRDDAQWLVRMVENLLSVTRMNGGEAKINKYPEAVEEIVSESTRKVMKHFPDAEVSVTVPQELLMVPMDAILIEQVIFNLLENAIIHGARNDAIELRVTTDESNAIITVRDHGVGISDDMMGHLFDGYRSGNDSDESDSKRNMGIGLSVCKSIVKVHGGEMTAQNHPDGGAEFTFTLPLND